MTSRIVLTYEDYAALPNDGKRHELHEGELSVTPTPGTWHQQVLLHFALVLAPSVRTQTSGQLLVAPLDCSMTDITVVQPDLLYVDETRRQLVSPRALEGAPTLAIEILSPSTKHIERRRTMALSATHGVEWYWIVDPDAQIIDAYRLEGGAYRPDARLDGPTVRLLPPFPERSLDPASIWA
jgi:Uma2 family endonuclease